MLFISTIDLTIAANEDGSEPLALYLTWQQDLTTTMSLAVFLIR